MSWEISCPQCGRMQAVDLIRITFIDAGICGLICYGAEECCRAYPTAMWKLPFNLREHIKNKFIRQGNLLMQGVVFSLYQGLSTDDFFGLNLIGKFTDWTDEEGQLDEYMLGVCNDNLDEAIREFQELRGPLREEPVVAV